MDMEMSMGGGPLSANGVNFANETQASDFLTALLNDDQLKVIGERYAQYFWYGAVVAIVLAAVANALFRGILSAR